MTFPTPTGAPPPISLLTSTQNAPESYFQQGLTKQWGAKAGAAYASYNAAHPENTPFRNAQIFVEMVLVEGLDAAIQAGVTGGTNVDIGTVQGATKGAENVVKKLSPLAAIGDFFSRLTDPHLWLRVAEFVVGGAFLIIGLNALLHNPIGKAAKAMPKVVPI